MKKEKVTQRSLNGDYTTMTMIVPREWSEKVSAYAKNQKQTKVAFVMSAVDREMEGYTLVKEKEILKRLDKIEKTLDELKS